MSAIQDKFIRENLMIQPVKQAPNPYIPNEADRIFAPKDDVVLKFARSFQAYNPNLKNWADREEARLVEKARSETMEILDKSGGLDHVKAKYFDNPNLDGVNPYLHREIGKEVLRRKSVEYNAAMKFAYDEEGWGSLSPDEFFKKAQEFEGQWKSDNANEFSMVDSRDMPEIFGAASEATLKVVSEGYYREKSASVRKVRNEEFQQRLNTEIRYSLQKHVDSKDYDYSKLIADSSITEDGDATKYDKVKAFLKESDAHLELMKTMSHYRQNMGMSKEDAFTLSLATLRDMATTDDGNTDAYIALASLLRDSYDETDANGKLTHIAMDKSEFAAWAAETEKTAIIAYQDRNERERIKYKAQYEKDQMATTKKFYEYLSELSSETIKNITPEKFFDELQVNKTGINHDMRPLVTSLLTNYQNAYDRPRTDFYIEQRAEVMMNIHKGAYKNYKDFNNALRSLHTSDWEAVYNEYTKNGEGKTSPKYNLIQKFIVESKPLFQDEGAPWTPEKTYTFGHILEKDLLEMLDSYETKNNSLPTYWDFKEMATPEFNKLKGSMYWGVENGKAATAQEYNATMSKQISTLTIDGIYGIAPDTVDRIKNNPFELESERQTLQEKIGNSYTVTNEDVIRLLDENARIHKEWTASIIQKTRQQKEQKHTADKQAQQNVIDYFSLPETQKDLMRVYPTDWEQRLRDMGVPIVIKQNIESN